MGILPSRHFDVRMTSYKNFLVILDLESKNTPPTPNLRKIKPISWQICKFLHFSVLQHIHNKRLPWQHLGLMRIVIMWKMTPISVRLNLKNFILISCAILELLRKVSQGGICPSPGEIGLTLPSYVSYIQPISFLVQFSEGSSSVLLQFLVTGSQVLLFNLSFNLAIEFLRNAYL